MRAPDLLYGRTRAVIHFKEITSQRAVRAVLESAPPGGPSFHTGLLMRDCSCVVLTQCIPIYSAKVFKRWLRVWLWSRYAGCWLAAWPVDGCDWFVGWLAGWLLVAAVVVVVVVGWRLATQFAASEKVV